MQCSIFSNTMENAREQEKWQRFKKLLDVTIINLSRSKFSVNNNLKKKKTNPNPQPPPD